ncbi:MAG: hypothetical protein ACRDCY_18315 [Aeromonas veronii]
MSNVNKAQALNALHAHINKVVPELQAYLASTSIRYKTNGDMFEKNAKAVSSILNCNMPARGRVTVKNYGNGTIALDFDINYRAGEYGASYLDVWVNPGNFEPFRTDFTAEDFEQATNEWNNLDEQIRNLQHQQSALRNKFHL